MSPFLLLPLALITPVLLAATLFAPIYASICAAAYIVYMPKAGGPHPLNGKWTDIFYMVDTYREMIQYWLQNMKSVGVLDYSAPVLCLPAIALLLAVWITWKLGKAMINVFHSAGGGH